MSKTVDQVERAIIMAAGKGERLRPVTESVPKPLIKVNGARIIDTIIDNLHLNGIHEIHVVVGYKKECFEEWQKDHPEIDLIENPDYEVTNNISSLYAARDYLESVIILDGDQIITDPDVLHADFDGSGYAASLIDGYTNEWILTVDNGIITGCLRDGGTAGWRLYSVSRWTRDDGIRLKQLVEQEFAEASNTGIYWDDVALFCYPDDFKLRIYTVNKGDIVEIDTYDELAEYDHSYLPGDHAVISDLPDDAMGIICDVLKADRSDISDISVMKKGMTNRTFAFTCGDRKYLFRVPGEGTDKLVNRDKEVAVYNAIKGRGYCDDVAYINSINGYKITRFLDNTRVCDANNISDLNSCMNLLRRLHDDSIELDYDFDIYEHIELYESLWEGTPSVYDDYMETKAHIYELREYIDAHIEKRCLAHIDSVPDNFLFHTDDEGSERLQLIDWEYSGMQDPDVDIAMFCIYSLYDRKETDRLIDIYYDNACKPETRIKIYCYMASCGLLWSNWCEYKRIMGVEFGDYSIAQYQYAKDYYSLVKEMIG